MKHDGTMMVIIKLSENDKNDGSDSQDVDNGDINDSDGYDNNSDGSGVIEKLCDGYVR